MDNKTRAYRTQKIFRKVLQSMAYVGRPVRIPKECISEYPDNRLFPATMEILQTLLDTTTGFFCGDADENTVREIRLRTSAYPEKPEAADFIVIPADAAENAARHVEAAKTGTIYDPHCSATVLIECRSVLRGSAYLCRGPGIDAAIRIAVQCSWNWEKSRREKNTEFPLGIDCIFVDGEGNLLSLPRTAKLDRQPGKEGV
ncbi:MAG: phosphonate C-P lyase system protein PhnH [Clostridiales Family XIII bacterium]|jgi:alpha-D-ribose 1-methylphosphonate 5-triphosphate synthase subunit PhnH|nr:phosphonate C-P lyase system protein PhnH [Clostridiales Family XIII bacterium]